MQRAIVVGAKEARDAAALTMFQVAVNAKTSDKTIQSIERERPVKLSTARRVAKALKLPADAVVVVEPTA